MVHNVSASRNPALFFAARVSLGALGLVTQVTVQCEKFFWLQRAFTPSTLDDALARARVLDEENRNFKLWWIPRTNHVRLITWNYLDPPKDKHLRHGKWILLDKLKTGALVALSKVLAPYAAIFYPSLFQLVGTVFNPPENISGPYYDLLPSPAPFTHQEAEWFVPADLAREAFRAYQSLLESENCWTNMVTELRYIAEDLSWLSPAYNRSSATISTLGNLLDFILSL